LRKGWKDRKCTPKGDSYVTDPADYFRGRGAGAAGLAERGEELVGTIRGEVLGAERLGERARAVARGHHLLPAQKHRGVAPLLLRLEDTRNVLDRVYHELNTGAEHGLDISPAGDWLLDNFYIVQEHIREIRTNLPKGYYDELPKLATGALAGYPRAYEVAIELIAHTEGHLDLEERQYLDVIEAKTASLMAGACEIGAHLHPWVTPPHDEEVTRAKAVVDAYEEAAKAGRGAIGKDGKMIDYANIRMAKALLKKFEVQSSK
jgi:hypothetical protein